MNTSKFDLVDGLSWHGNSTELLFTPSQDGVQSLQAGVSVRHPIRQISAPNLIRHGSTVPTDSADAELDLRGSAGLRNLTRDRVLPPSRPSGHTNWSRMVTPQAGHARSRSLAAAFSYDVPESGQVSLGRPGLVSCTPVSDCQTANYKCDQASVTCLDVKSEAQQTSATLIEEEREVWS